jgi:hypothetical protein
MINTCTHTAGHVVAQIGVIVELCPMVYLAKSRVLGSLPQGNTYT